jgi:hypothetical protein
MRKGSFASRVPRLPSHANPRKTDDLESPTSLTLWVIKDGYRPTPPIKQILFEVENPVTQTLRWAATDRDYLTQPALLRQK